MISERIESALHKAGVDPIPGDPETLFSETILDSLRMVMIISELEQEFKLRIPADRVHEGVFKNRNSLESLIKDCVG